MWGIGSKLRQGRRGERELGEKGVCEGAWVGRREERKERIP